MCEKHKINDLFKSYTYPSPSKAIPNSEINLNDKVNIYAANKNNSKKSCTKIKKSN